jgi:hypothetical protein
MPGDRPIEYADRPKHPTAGGHNLKVIGRQRKPPRFAGSGPVFGPAVRITSIGLPPLPVLPLRVRLPACRRQAKLPSVIFWSGHPSCLSRRAACRAAAFAAHQPHCLNGSPPDRAADRRVSGRLLCGRERGRSPDSRRDCGKSGWPDLVGVHCNRWRRRPSLSRPGSGMPGARMTAGPSVHLWMAAGHTGKLRGTQERSALG